MKLLCKNPIAALLVIFVMLFGIGLVGPLTAQAATLPPLGTVSSFAVLAGAAVSDTAVSSTINGNVGLSPTGGTGITVLSCTDVTGTIYDTNGGYTGGHDSNTACLVTNAGLLITAKANLSTAYNDAKLQVPAIAVTASTTDSFAGVGYTLAPGIYNSASTMGVPVALTLDGGGDPNAVFIFQAGSTLNTVAGSIITLTGGANSSNVFWQVGTSATLGTTSQFEGTIMAAVSITDTGGSTINGRLLADADNTDADSTGAVTLNDTTITAPVTGNITVTKIVVGGSNVIADFPLFVNGGLVVSGVTNPFAPGAYTITETGNTNYTVAYSGDCVGGTVNLLAGDNKFCIVTNTYTAPLSGGGYEVIPPLIDVVKVPSPLALPAGPGSVTYTYTVTNPGTVPLDDVTMVGDTCSPIALISGDTNSDSRLQSNETWVYTCTTTLTETHTNNIVASGSANGITAIDIASATVIVGIPALVPPLIHITKVPNPLSLSNGGGMVTYTKKVTNPGTVPLSNVLVTDDKCSPVTYVSGDSNSDSRLDPSETWTYTCSKNLTQTTTNTATAIGQANGMTARDIAIATVVVTAPIPPVPPAPVPALPDTGFAPQNLGLVVLAFIIMIASIFLAVTLRKRTN